MSIISPVVGRAGLYSARTASFRLISTGELTFKPGGGTIDGTRTRDILNTGYTNVLRPGLLMAKSSSTGKYSNWRAGSLNAAYNGYATSMTVTAVDAAEITSRIGASGTFVVTGPPTANGTARQVTVTYSGISGTTVTVTAVGVAEVHQIKFGTAATGGNLQLTVQKSDGTFVTTGNAAWSATDATFLSNINTALDAVTTAAGDIVATAISATDTDYGVVLTYSRSAYPTGATLPQVAVLPSSATAPVVTRTTTAVDGRFVTASIISESGFQTPITFVPDDVGLTVPTDGTDSDFPHVPIAGQVQQAQMLPYPSDTGLRAWIKASMKATGAYVFDADV